MFRPQGAGNPVEPRLASALSQTKAISVASGTVKWFNVDKGFGFIQPQDGSKDVFVHITALQAAGISNLNDGQKVTYDVVAERGKQAAANLKLG
jgi:CspA family cold shock protein